MTLNAGFSYNSPVPGAVQMAARRRLEGPERGLDALVGLVILVAELLIGLLSIYALYELGSAVTESSRQDAVQAGFAIALFAGGALVLITTIAYLGRVIVGRRSWPAPLWGVALMSVAIIVGYFVMFA